MIGRAIMTGYFVLVPPKALVKTLFLFSFVQLMGFEIIVSIHFLQSFEIPLFYLGQILFGLGRGILSFSYLILIRTFNQPSDRSSVNIYLALSRGGNIYGFYLETLFLDNLNLHWTLGLTIFALIYLFISFLMFVIVK